MMSCQMCELELGAQVLSSEAAAHLEACANCRETFEVVSRAALPEVTAHERAGLAGLGADTQAKWVRDARRGRVFWGVARYGLAAGLGALLATGVLMKAQAPAPVSASFATAAEQRDLEEPVQGELVASTFGEPLLLDDWPSMADDDFHLSDEEVFFEVSWPSGTEGEL